MADVSELSNDLVSGDAVKVYRARQALQKLCSDVSAPGREADRAAAASKIAAQLAAIKPAKDNRGEATTASMTSVSAATDLCRSLAEVAGDAEVSIIAECLKNIDLREPARWCLERMNAPAATAALVAALGTAAGTEFRVGVINALTRKKDAAAVEALTTAAKDNDAEVRLAAVEALSQHADAKHDAVIAAVETGTNSRRRARAARARIRLGQTLLRDGQTEAAQKVFAAVASGDAPAAQKKAAATR